MSAPGWGEPGWAPELRPGRTEYESHQAMLRIAAGLIDETGRLNPEGPRKRLTEFDRAVLAHEATVTARTVAALYVDPNGPYPSMPGVDAWDETRDARTYAGPHPVVAHPPCGPWGKLSHFSKQDASGGPAAVAAVRRWGGVLEHPEYSKLWRHCGMPRPGEPPDDHGGITIAVDQCAYGHCTRKRTWLYLVGVRLPAIRTGGEPTHSICNGRGQVLRDGSRRERATALQARLTPPAFAEFLVSVACGAPSRHAEPTTNIDDVNLTGDT